MFDWKLSGDYDFFPNAFQFYSSYEREFELSSKHRGDVGVTSFLEKLTEVKKRVDKYIYEQLPDDIINYVSNSNDFPNYSIDSFLNEFMNENSFRKILNQLDGRMKSEITKLPELVDKRNQKFLTTITTSLEDGLDARFKNSLNISPSEGSSISEAFVRYFYNMDEGETNLFFDKNNVFKNKDVIISEFKKIRNMNERIYGNIIDQDKFEKIVNSAIEMKKNGSSNEEIFNFINQSKKQVIKELDDVVGISLIDEKYFKQLVKGTQYEGKKTAYGVLARNPTIYQTSILYSRISSIGDKDIENVPYLQTLFGNGGLERTSDRITSYNIGRMTMQAMNGDYDGDKIYAAILSRFDLFGNNKNLQLNEIEKEIKRDNILLNAIRKNIDIFEEIKKYEMGNKNGNKMLQEIFDNIIYGSKFKTGSVDEQRIFLKNTLFPLIKTYDNAMSMWEDKLIDELGDAKKTVHMNTYYKFYSDSLGKEVNVKNGFWYNLYKHSDSIAKNKLGNMTTEETLKTLYSIKGSDVFSKLSKVEQELVDNLIANPEKFNEVFKEILEKDNKNLRIMFSDFGTPTYLRAYLDNIKTGTANVELTEQSKFVRRLVLDDSLENQIDFITKKINIKDSSKDWWLKDFRSFYDKEGKLKQDEVDNFRTLIKVLTGDDLYGELQEKAISSKHGQDSAEALIEYHKKLIKSVGVTTVDVKELNGLKKTFAGIYSARTEEQLKKINFIDDYFRVFTSKNKKYSSDDILINNAKNSIKSLLKLMGVFSDEIFDDIDNASSVNDFTLDNISKWFGVKIENGIIDQKSYKKMQRYFSHLNGVVIADIFNKFSQDKDGSKTFTSIFNEFKREKNLTKFLFESVSVLPEKAISAFSFVFGKKHKVKDIEVPEQEIEEAISDIQDSDEVQETIENIVNQEVKTDEKKIKNTVKAMPNKSEDPNFNVSEPQNNLSLESDSEVNLKQLQKNKKENLLNNGIDNKQKNIKDIINKDINSEEFNNIDDITNNHIEHIEDSKLHISNVFDAQNDFSKAKIENNQKELPKNNKGKSKLSKNNNVDKTFNDNKTKNIKENSYNFNNKKNETTEQLELLENYHKENKIKEIINKEVKNNQNISLITNNPKDKVIKEASSNNNIDFESFIEQEINAIENKVKDEIHDILTEIKQNSIDNSEAQNASFSKPEIEINSKQLQEIINEKEQVINNKNNISNVVENELKDNITNYLENEDNNQIENNIKIHKKLKNEDNKVLRQLELFNEYSEENEVKKIIDKEVEQKQNIATTINEIKKDEIEEVLNNNIEDVSTTKQNFSVQEAVQEINEKQIE